MRRFLCAAALVTLPPACASTGDSERLAVPLHVGVIPVAVTTVGDIEPGEPDEEQKENRVQVSVASEELSAELVAALENAGFSRATVLSLPSTVPAEEFASWELGSRDAHWIAEGKASGVDVLLDCELRLVPLASSRRNDKFWLNFPLFILGGPLGYFVADRTYEVEAHLYGRLHEQNALELERAGLEGRATEILRPSTRFEGADIDLSERAGADGSTLILSMFVPFGLLARDGPRVERAVSEHVTEDLAQGMAEELYQGRTAIVEADRIAAFHLLPAVEVRRVQGGLSVEGEVVVFRTESERMEEFVIVVGDERHVGTFDEGVVDVSASTRRALVVRFPFEATLSPAAIPETIRIELLGGGRQLAVRTYTCRVRS